MDSNLFLRVNIGLDLEARTIGQITAIPLINEPVDRHRKHGLIKITIRTIIRQTITRLVCANFTAEMVLRLPVLGTYGSSNRNYVLPLKITHPRIAMEKAKLPWQNCATTHPVETRPMS